MTSSALPASQQAWGSLAPGTAEAKIYVVPPSGSDLTDGSAVSPFRTIGHAAALVRAGDKVVVKAGVYTERVVFPNAGEPGKPIVFEASPPGMAQLSGDAGFQPAQRVGDDDVLASSGGGWVTISGFVFRHMSGPAVPASRAWLIDRCRFQGAGFGVNIKGHDVVVANATSDDINGPNAHAVVAVASPNILPQNDTIRRVNTQRQIFRNSRSAVTKFVGTGPSHQTSLGRRQCWTGIVAGLGQSQLHYSRQRIRRHEGDNATWEGGGLLLEGNGSAHGRVFKNELFDNTGPGIAVMESGGIEIRHNRLERNSE